MDTYFPKLPLIDVASNCRDGNYLLGGHTTAGVTNWDYLAIKVGKHEFIKRERERERGGEREKKKYQGNTLELSTRLTETQGKSCGEELMDNQEDLIPGSLILYLGGRRGNHNHETICRRQVL